MKIDKRRPSHWLCLFLFGLNVLGARLWRRRRARRAGRPLVILYGHKLSGNLLAIHRHWQAHARADWDMVFLTMDKPYHRQLKAQGVSSVLATRWPALRLLRCADAVISDHGLHVLRWLLGAPGLKFIDVWHGIPFKGFDAADFTLQHRFDETWVASPLLQRLYLERYGFAADRVQVTGYARTDRLVRREEKRDDLKRQFGLSSGDGRPIVLFAPTWKQDAHQRSIYPFGTDEQTFLQTLSHLAAKLGVTVVMRTHLNSRAAQAGTWEHIVQRPFAAYPDTEGLLLVSDVLICDWSSIAFDWLLLELPTLFLDVSPPFAKDLSLGPEYRYGAVVASLDVLAQQLTRFVEAPDSYIREYGGRQTAIRQQVYGDCADGSAAARCLGRLPVIVRRDSGGGRRQ